jgi:hypothetical protein
MPRKQADSVEIIDISSDSDSEVEKPLPSPRKRMHVFQDENGNPYVAGPKYAPRPNRKGWKKPIDPEYKAELCKRLEKAREVRKAKKEAMMAKEEKLYEAVPSEDENDSQNESEQELSQEPEEPPKKTKGRPKAPPKAKKRAPAKPRNKKKAEQDDLKAQKIAELEEKITILTQRTKEVKNRKPVKQTQIIVQPPVMHQAQPEQKRERTQKQAEKVLDFFSK